MRQQKWKKLLLLSFGGLFFVLNCESGNFWRTLDDKGKVLQTAEEKVQRGGSSTQQGCFELLKICQEIATLCKNNQIQTKKEKVKCAALTRKCEATKQPPCDGIEQPERKPDTAQPENQTSDQNPYKAERTKEKGVPDTHQSDTHQSDTHQPDTHQPDTNQPDTNQPDTSGKPAIKNPHQSLTGKWLNIPLGETLTGEFVVAFSVYPQATNAHGVIGLSDRNTMQFSDQRANIRLAPKGIFEALNKNQYQADQIISYSKNTTYHVEMQVSVPKKTFDVRIYTDSTPKKMLAKQYQFRLQASQATFLDRVVIWSEKGNFLVGNIRILWKRQAKPFHPYTDLDPKKKQVGLLTAISKLKYFKGAYVIKKDGALVENMHIVGRIDVVADNVTIRNCLIDGGNGIYQEGISYRRSSPTSTRLYKGLLISHVEVKNIKVGINLFASKIVTTGDAKTNRIEYAYIHHVGDGMRGNSMTVYRTRIEARIAPWTNNHCDGIQIVNKGNVHIQDSYIAAAVDNPYSLDGNAAVFLAQDFLPAIKNVTIDNCYLSGGGHIYRHWEPKNTGKNGFERITGSSVTNSWFGSVGLWKIKKWKPAVAYEGADKSPIWKNNRFIDNNAPVPLERR